MNCRWQLAEAASARYPSHCVVCEIRYILMHINDGLLKKLQAVQNAAGCVTTKTRKFDHITSVLRELHWFLVRKRIIYKLAVMVYKCLHGLSPPYLAADCVPVTLVASRRHLRSAVSGCLAVTGTRTTLGRRNFAVTGATIWNNLPADLRLHSQSLLSFGQKLKQYLFEPWAHLRNFLKSRYTNVRIIIIIINGQTGKGGRTVQMQ